MDKEQLISKYFLAKLSDEEKQTFDMLMADDVWFKKEVEFQNKVRLAAINLKRTERKSQLQEIEKGIQASRSRRKWWVVAASVLILVSAGFYFLNQDTSTEALFSNYYEPAKNIIHPIVRNGDENSNLTMAFIEYQKGEYQSAGQLFEKEFQISNKSELLFYRAICLIETDQTELAQESLKEHQKYTDVLSDRTSWYLALAYLKGVNKEKAKSILKEISNSPDAYKHKEARSLLKKL